MSGPRVIDWLLEEDQPAVRYWALVELLGGKERDPEVQEARRGISKRGWGRDLLALQGPKGFWERREPRNVKEWIDFLQFPPFRCTFWIGLVLSDLGLDATNPQVKRVADLIFTYKLRLGSPFNFFFEEPCISANAARMMTRFGFAEDRRVRKLFAWLLEDQREDGGWNCSQGTPGTLDVWEPLAAFAALPRTARSAEMERSIARGAEFYLKRGLLREGRPYSPWTRTHYPNYYFYDFLVGLEVLTRLGYGGDRRLKPALSILKKTRRGDGRWLLDRSHPDIGPGVEIHPDPSKIKPIVLERPGEPSKWITLTALRVLKRVEEAA